MRHFHSHVQLTARATSFWPNPLPTIYLCSLGQCPAFTRELVDANISYRVLAGYLAPVVLGALAIVGAILFAVRWHLRDVVMQVAMATHAGESWSCVNGYYASLNSAKVSTRWQCR